MDSQIQTAITAFSASEFCGQLVLSDNSALSWNGNKSFRPKSFCPISLETLRNRAHMDSFRKKINVLFKKYSKTLNFTGFCFPLIVQSSLFELLDFYLSLVVIEKRRFHLFVFKKIIIFSNEKEIMI